MFVEVEYVDYGVHGEYGPFGKVIARSSVAGMTPAQIEREIAEMKLLLGDHVVPVYVEAVPALYH